MITSLTRRIPRQANTLALPPRIANLSAGLWDSASLMLAAAPFGIITGATSVDGGLSPAMTMAMSLGVFAGASQLAALQMIAAGHLPAVVVLTALLINLRLALYSAAIAPHFQSLSGRWKWFLAYLLTDQAFVISLRRFETDPQGPHRQWFYLGAALGLWIVWQLANACGALLETRVPEDLPLDFAVALIFLALLVPAIRDRATVAAAVAAGITAVLGADLPHGLGLALAALVGIAVGLWTETQTGRT